MLLAIDTASRFMSLALHDGQRLLAEQTQYCENRQTVLLVAAVQRLLNELEFPPANLAALAISQGPGSFSGLRVGFGVAKGLATALHIPLIPVPTLDIVAAGVPLCDGQLLAVIQAGRGRIIVGGYQRGNNRWQPSRPPTITTWEKLLPELQTPTLISGEIDGLDDAWRQAAPPSVQVASAAWNMRRAGFLAELGWDRYAKGDYSIGLAQINPIYLKEP